MHACIKVKEVRVTADSLGAVGFVYKSNSTVDGWYPRPFEKLTGFKAIAEVFSHPSDSQHQGHPVQVVACYPGSSSDNAERGKRQTWFYKIKYAGGDIHLFELKCIPIIFNFPNEMDSVIQNLARQPFDKELKNSSKRDDILDSIRQLLEARSGIMIIMSCSL